MNFYGLAMMLFEHIVEETAIIALEPGLEHLAPQLRPTSVIKVGFPGAT